MPFGEQAWNHARHLLAARGSDPATEAEIAAAAADLLGRAGKGPDPGPGGQGPPQQHQAAGSIRSPRSRRVTGRTTATASPQWPRPAPGPVESGEDEEAAGQASGPGPGPGTESQAEQPAEAETLPGQVIPLPLFDARKEAEKWW